MFFNEKKLTYQKIVYLYDMFFSNTNFVNLDVKRFKIPGLYWFLFKILGIFYFSNFKCLLAYKLLSFNKNLSILF